MSAKSTASLAAPALHDRRLVLQLGGPHRVLSWAIVNGGRRTASEVVWCEVRDEELRPPVDPERLLRERLAEACLPDAVGLLTSRALARHVMAERESNGARARCVATVGLGNALRAGDPPGPAGRIGTINLVCQLFMPLSELALLEALSIAAEARTAAVLEAGIASQRTAEPATGTGTDCIVIAAPDRPSGARYVGKHTVAGHLVGATVYEATRAGVAGWLSDRREASTPGCLTRSPPRTSSESNHGAPPATPGRTRIYLAAPSAPTSADRPRRAAEARPLSRVNEIEEGVEP